MRAVDTNVLVRLITRDDPRQAASAEAFIQGGAWVSHIVLVETVWVLKSVYALDDERIQAVIEVLLGHVHLSVQEPEIVTAALEAYRERPALGFSDCLIVAVARKAGHVPVGTFDRGLAKLTGAQLLSNRR